MKPVIRGDSALAWLGHGATQCGVAMDDSEYELSDSDAPGESSDAEIIRVSGITGPADGAAGAPAASRGSEGGSAAARTLQRGEEASGSGAPAESAAQPLGGDEAGATGAGLGGAASVRPPAPPRAHSDGRESALNGAAAAPASSAGAAIGTDSTGDRRRAQPRRGGAGGGAGAAAAAPSTTAGEASMIAEFQGEMKARRRKKARVKKELLATGDDGASTARIGGAGAYLDLDAADRASLDDFRVAHQQFEEGRAVVSARRETAFELFFVSGFCPPRWSWGPAPGPAPARPTTAKDALAAAESTARGYAARAAEVSADQLNAVKRLLQRSVELAHAEDMLSRGDHGYCCSPQLARWLLDMVAFHPAPKACDVAFQCLALLLLRTTSDTSGLFGLPHGSVDSAMASGRCTRRGASLFGTWGFGIDDFERVIAAFGGDMGSVDIGGQLKDSAGDASGAAAGASGTGGAGAATAASSTVAAGVSISASSASPGTPGGDVSKRTHQLSLVCKLFTLALVTDTHQVSKKQSLRLAVLCTRMNIDPRISAAKTSIRELTSAALNCGGELTEDDIGDVVISLLEPYEGKRMLPGTPPAVEEQAAKAERLTQALDPRSSIPIGKRFALMQEQSVGCHVQFLDEHAVARCWISLTIDDWLPDEGKHMVLKGDEVDTLDIAQLQVRTIRDVGLRRTEHFQTWQSLGEDVARAQFEGKLMRRPLHSLLLLALSLPSEPASASQLRSTFAVCALKLLVRVQARVRNGEPDEIDDVSKGTTLTSKSLTKLLGKVEAKPPEGGATSAARHFTLFFVILGLLDLCVESLWLSGAPQARDAASSVCRACDRWMVARVAHTSEASHAAKKRCTHITTKYRPLLQ